MPIKNQNAVDEILKGVKKKYLALGERLVKKIIANLEKGMTATQAVNRAFDLYNVGDWMLTTTRDAMVFAAASALGVNQSFAVRSKGITNKVLHLSYDASKVKFSKRIHGTEKQMKRTIISIITQSISDKDQITKMAGKLFDGYDYGNVIQQQKIASDLKRLASSRMAGIELDEGLQSQITALSRRVGRLRTEPLKTAYKDLLKAIESGTENQIEKNIWIAVQEKSRYQANMIMRTETARAYYKAFESRAVLDPDVSGVKVTLSTAHKIFDICDLHANLDLGYGPGVYPLSKLPEYPLHPHCFCRLTEVYLNRVPENVKVSKEKTNESIRDYLNSVSDQELVDLLGKQGSEQYKKNGEFNTLRNYSGFHKAKTGLTQEDFIK